MANIITDVGGENMVRVDNARFARQPLPEIFTGWTKLRVALLLNILDSGVNITGTIRFAYGLCAGSTNIPGDATCTHFVGGLLASSPWARNTPPTRYSGNAFAAKLVGTTLTTSAIAACTYVVTPSQMLFIDITKGSPNYSLQAFFSVSTTVATYATFLTQSLAGTPSATGHSYPAAETIAVNEGVDGILDHACVWWNKADPAWDIAAWRVFRLE